jgi:hypothetical protein
MKSSIDMTGASSSVCVGASPADVDESMMTGELQSVSKRPGEKVSFVE